MKRVGMLAGLLLAVAGLAHAATDDEAPYGDQAAGTEDGNQYMPECTDAGVADGLSGDELDAYVQDCMDNPYTVYQAPTGDDS